MKNKIKITPLGIGETHLAFVKVIKFSTDLGLKEAKEWCDEVKTSFREGRRESFYLDINVPIEKFRSEMFNIGSNYIFLISDREDSRNLKLISLGIGDKSDKLDLLSDELASDLLMETRYHRSGESLIKIYKEFILKTIEMFNMSDEDLNKIVDKIVDNKIKNIQNG